MDNATSAQRAFVNVAGFIYASFGFSLSVITALFNLFFHRSNARHELMLALPSHSHHKHTHPHTHPRRPIRSLSEHSIKIPPSVAGSSPKSQRLQASPSSRMGVISRQTSLPATPVKSIHQVSEEAINEKLPKTPSEKEQGVYPHHVRSRSIPTIMVDMDHLDSPEHMPWKTPSPASDHRVSGPVALLPQSQSHVTPPSSAQTTSTIHTTKSGGSICPITGKLKPRLFDPKSWGGHKRLKRCQSSPQLSKPPGLPIVESPPPSQSISSDPETPPPPLKRVKTWRTLRKAKSGPYEDKPAPKADRKTEKKRSQTLRTHPYEAPYFAPPPIPSLPVHVTLISDHTTSDYSSSIDSSPKSSLDRKSSAKS